MTKQPKGFYKYHIFCCTNVRHPKNSRGSCGQKGSGDLRDYMKAKAKELGIKDCRVNTSGCLDKCELGPTMVIYPDNVWYRYKSKEDIDEILDSHCLHGRLVERLLMQQEKV
jgi:(2Fe-2S) ferredoxin|tara:strand:+ start:3763 stop:4098 length:336 start_codon:yes stop_codon:yes gene_type:complete